MMSSPNGVENFLLRWKVSDVKLIAEELLSQEGAMSPNVRAGAMAFIQAISTPDILVRVVCKKADEIDEVVDFVGPLTERYGHAKPGQVDILMEEMKTIYSSVDLIRWLQKGITIELVNGSAICVCLDKEAPITKETL